MLDNEASSVAGSLFNLTVFLSSRYYPIIIDVEIPWLQKSLLILKQIYIPDT